MRIAFFGTPSIAVPYLEALVDAGHELCTVITQPDRPAGRGQKLRASAVKEAALRLGIPVLQPKSCRDLGLQQAIREAGAELGVVVAYGNLLPPDLLVCPIQGCINVHYSLLPQLRGAAPVQHALLKGLSQTGVTIQWMSPQLDAGDIIVAEPVAIHRNDDCGILFEKLNAVGPKLLLHAVSLIACGKAPRLPQDESQASWAPPLTRFDCCIDWSVPAEHIRNLVRACSPRPGAFTFWRGRRLKLLRVETVDRDLPLGEGIPGALAEVSLQGDPVVYAGVGAVALLRVQPEGKQPMAGGD
ncbi:MAG: methionyl-tRNA formyltransferase, partial [Candidatus Zipacnadales bacterium]